LARSPKFLRFFADFSIFRSRKRRRGPSVKFWRWKTEEINKIEKEKKLEKERRCDEATEGKRST